MSEDMIERVARALALARAKAEHDDKQKPEESWEAFRARLYRSMAKAAVDAMELTDVIALGEPRP